MVTVRAGNTAIWMCLLVLGGCSREQQDWRSAEAADTIESYGRFIQQHPESELTTQARTRVAQLGEDRDWQHAGSADSVDAYREFLSQHPNGKWAQEARIRIENFSLGEQAGTDAGSRAAAAAIAHGSPPVGGDSRGTSSASAADGNLGRMANTPTGPASGASGSGIAVPGEAAVASGGTQAHAGVEAQAPNASGSAKPASNGGGGPWSLAGTPAGGPPAGSTPAGGPPAAGGTPVGGTSGGSTLAGGNPASGAPATGSIPGANPPAAGAPGGNVPGGLTPTTRVPLSDPSQAAFGIQLGAFSSEAGASNQWHALTARFPTELQGLQEHVVPADTPTGRVYRLQATVGAEQRARAICDALRKQSQGCVAVLPH
jgi:hypothetical protein